MSEFPHTRRRGGSFRLDFDNHDNSFREDDNAPVQFITPYYESQDRPEPLDLSKLKLDNIESGYSNENDQEDEDDEEAREEIIRTRGRSRSRSIHANDSNVTAYLPQLEGQPNNTKDDQNNTNKIKPRNGAAERSGPLPHREVAALQKGLEEATQCYSKSQTREDEEERMAADAEKRKRMLAAATHQQTNQISPDSEPSRRIKLLLLGDSGVGKSSLILRWTLDAFSPSMISTVGVNFKTRKILHNNEIVQVQVWDTAGQEQFHKITTSYYKGAQGIMLVYDVSDVKKLENVEYWIKNIKSHASDSVQVVLVGNKIDLRTSDPHRPCIDTERGKEIARRFSVPFFETSAKESSHVDEAFTTLVAQIIDLNSISRNIAGRMSLQGLDHQNRKLIVDKLEKHEKQMKDLERQEREAESGTIGNSAEGNNGNDCSNESNLDSPEETDTSGNQTVGHKGKFPKFSSLFHGKGGNHNSQGSTSSTESTESSSGGSTSSNGGNGERSKSPQDKEKCVIS